MALLTDNSQKKKLKDYSINIKTKYIVGNKILERNTDDTINDDITNGIRYEKDYYINNSLVHKETVFDSRIEYTFISKEMENKEYKCPNCGNVSKIKSFEDGCPYCRTYYNIDYTDKDLGSKYHYDLILHSNTYRIITAIIDLLISIVLCYFFIKNTSRTFNNIDIIKIFVYGAILALVLYYLFYTLDAYIILGPIKKYKETQNQKQIDFWNRTRIDKKEFFNNVNYELRNYYYSNSNIVDFDVIDYMSFNDYTKKDGLYVNVKAYIRVIYYNHGKLTSKLEKNEYVFHKVTDEVVELKDGINYIKCPHCGASVDATKGSCSYCHKPINRFQKWMLIK